MLIDVHASPSKCTGTLGLIDGGVIDKRIENQQLIAHHLNILFLNTISMQCTSMLRLIVHNYVLNIIIYEIYSYFYSLCSSSSPRPRSIYLIIIYEYT